MEAEFYDYGMIGLGTMGGNLMQNMGDNGYAVAGYDKDVKKVDELNTHVGGSNIKATASLQEFVNSLKKPRVIMMLVPAGKVVDIVIEDLKPFVDKGDIIIDCGNSHFTDTQQRTDRLVEQGLHFMGIGISGGETGARFGPSIMPGGDEQAYNHIAHMLQAVSAKVNGEPCTAYMGKGAAGHYVKMVHNGIEYAIMQMLAESYHMLKKLGGFSNDELHDIYSKYNSGKLNSYLVQISAAIFKQPDADTDHMLIDVIADTAKQKGTGAWTSEDAMKILCPVPVIDVSVTQRIMSSMKQQRVTASRFYNNPIVDHEAANKDTLVMDVENALYAGFILTYSQGLSLLKKASETYNYGINLPTVASIWRGGCIIRAAMLNDITKVLRESDAENLLLSDHFSKLIMECEPALRRIVMKAVTAGIPVPALGACLTYKDSYFSEWLPANLIQAQRDFFGAHTYERTDKEGIFHTEWNEKIQ